jgi:hypothetical protein
MSRRYNKYERATEKRLTAKGISPTLAKADRTTKADLFRIWDEIREDGMPDLLVEWDYKYNPKTMRSKPLIMNLGNPFGAGGSHWITVLGSKYFDS